MAYPNIKELPPASTLCGATEAKCICLLPKDHEPPHECGDNVCMGQWTVVDGQMIPFRWPSGRLVADTPPLTEMALVMGLIDEETI